MSWNYELTESRINLFFASIATKDKFLIGFPNDSLANTAVHQHLHLINCQRCLNSPQTFGWRRTASWRCTSAAAASPLRVHGGCKTYAKWRWDSPFGEKGPLRPVAMSLTSGGQGLWTSPTVVEKSYSEGGPNAHQRVSSFPKGDARTRARASKDEIVPFRVLPLSSRRAELKRTVAL